jgi:hypothetical protein
MTPTEMHIDALMEKIEKLEAENAQLKEEKKQWEPEWFSQAAANAAGYNQALVEIKKLEAENKKLTMDLSEAEKLTRYAGDLIYLIENSYTVVAGINSFWVADIEGTSRVGPKCVTVAEAIDTFRSYNP